MKSAQKKVNDDPNSVQHEINGRTLYNKFQGVGVTKQRPRVLI